MTDIYGPRDFKHGQRAAYNFGAEFQANPGSDMKEYKDNAAFYFRPDVEEFKDLTLEEKHALLTAFRQGREAEKALQ